MYLQTDGASGFRLEPGRSHRRNAPEIAGFPEDPVLPPTEASILLK